MTTSQKRYENETGLSSVKNSLDIFPDTDTYSDEYVKWLEDNLAKRDADAHDRLLLLHECKEHLVYVNRTDGSGRSIVLVEKIYKTLINEASNIASKAKIK